MSISAENGVCLMPGLDGGQIYTLMTSGPGSSSLHNASASWKKVAPLYDEAFNDINNALQASRATWQGDAADATGAGISPMGAWALAAQDESARMSVTSADQAENFDNTVRNLEPPPNVPEKPWYNNTVPWDTDFDSAMRKKAENDIHNTEILARYSAATSTTMTGVEGFQAPDEVGDGAMSQRGVDDARVRTGAGSTDTGSQSRSQNDWAAHGGAGMNNQVSQNGNVTVPPGNAPGNVNQQIVQPQVPGPQDGRGPTPLPQPGTHNPSQPGFGPGLPGAGIPGGPAIRPGGGPGVPGAGPGTAGAPPRGGTGFGPGTGGHPGGGGGRGGGVAGGFGPIGSDPHGDQRRPGGGGYPGMVDDHHPQQRPAGAARPAAAGPGMGGMPLGGMPVGQGGRQGEDTYYETKSYLVCEENANLLIGELPKTVPPVLGE